MRFGLSYVGLVFLLMLMVPNLVWVRNKPKAYDQYAKNEKRVLVMLERIGEILVTCIVLVFRDFNIQPLSPWVAFLVAAMAFMLLYEGYWIRYFRSQRTMKDFYSSLWGIPVAGAALPVIAFFLLGVYGRNMLLIVAVVILGIGHIGIHWNHRKEIV